MFSPRLAPVLPLTSANAVKSLPSLFLEPLTTCHFSIVRQEMLMRLIATELLSPPRTAPERLRSAPCGGTGTGFNALRGHILHQQPPKPSYCPPTPSTPQNPLTFGSPHKARLTSEPPHLAPCLGFPKATPGAVPTIRWDAGMWRHRATGLRAPSPFPPLPCFVKKKGSRAGKEPGCPTRLQPSCCVPQPRAWLRRAVPTASERGWRSAARVPAV